MVVTRIMMTVMMMIMKLNDDGSGGEYVQRTVSEGKICFLVVKVKWRQVGNGSR